MRLVAMIMALGVVLATGACGGDVGDERTVVSTSTSEAGGRISPTTTPAHNAEEGVPAGSRTSTTATSASTPEEGGPTATRPTVRVSLHAEAGEIPPGRVQQADAPVWKATGGGWGRGDVELLIRRAGEVGVVMTAGGRADASGRWEQTFVLPPTAQQGTYVAVASQGPLSAEGSFELTLSPAGPEVVDSGSAPAGEWQLLAERQPSGLLCAVLKVGGRDEGLVCNAPSEQDFNGDDVLRYSSFGDGTFVVGISASGVDKVRARLGDGTIVERATVEAPFAGSRFVALPLPAQSVVLTLVALGDNGQVFTSFSLNP